MRPCRPAKDHVPVAGKHDKVALGVFSPGEGYRGFGLRHPSGASCIVCRQMQVDDDPLARFAFDRKSDDQQRVHLFDE